VKVKPVCLLTCLRSPTTQTSQEKDHIFHCLTMKSSRFIRQSHLSRQCRVHQHLPLLTR